jgi:hypothetical protein
MNPKKFNYILIGGLALIVAAGMGIVFYGESFLQKQAEEISALKVESAVLQDQQRDLIQAKKDIDTNTELESIVKTIVPQDKDQAKTVREIVQIAQRSNVSIASISFPSSALGQQAKKPPTSSDKDSPSSPPTATAQKDTQIKPAEGLAGLFQMEINIQSNTAQPVPYENLIDFLRKLESNRRTAQVSNLSVTPDSTNRNLVTFNLLINVYIRP